MLAEVERLPLTKIPHRCRAVGARASKIGMFFGRGQSLRLYFDLSIIPRMSSDDKHSYPPSSFLWRLRIWFVIRLSYREREVTELDLCRAEISLDVALLDKLGGALKRIDYSTFTRGILHI